MRFPSDLQLALDFSQRWRGRRPSYRPSGETIDTRRLAVASIDEGTAKRYVVEHHYSGTYPAARCRVGLYRKLPFEADRLVGVAVFSVSAQPRALGAYFGDVGDGCELGRFVLDDDVEGMGETWFLSRAFGVLRSEKRSVEVVLSYSDPVERKSAAGVLVKPGHVGGIYLAHNAVYFGRAAKQKLLIAPDGRCLSRRSLNKVAVEDRGWRGVCEMIETMGGPARAIGESGDSYHRRVMASGTFRVMHHPGNHAWGWALTAAKRRLVHQRPWLRPTTKGDCK